MAIKQIVGTNPFQDPQGNVLANGTLTFDLSQPAVVSGSGEVVPTRVTITLNSSGTFSAVNFWANDQLVPTGTTYRMKAYNSNGLLVGDFGAQSIQGASPIDVSSLTPVSSSSGTVSYPGPVLLNPSAPQTITGQSLTLTSSAPLIVQGSATFSGSTTINTANNVIHVGGNTGLTLAQGIAACPGSTAGCHIVVDGNLTFTTPVVYSTAGSPLEIECVNPATANGNTGGTELIFSPASGPAVGITLQNSTTFVMRGCNYHQGNSTDGSSVALTNIVGNGATATANCSAPCQSLLTNAVQGGTGGVIVSITGNSNGGFNNPFAVLSFPTTSSFTFASSVNATGTSGSAIVGVTGLLCQGCQKSSIENSQIFGFTGVQYQITDSSSSSGEYNAAYGTHIRGGRITFADNVIGYAAGKSANENKFFECSVGGGTVRAVLTTGGASEVGFFGGEVSDATPGSEPIIIQFGDGVNACRDNDVYSITNESPASAPTSQIAILNGCQGSVLNFEGGLGGTTPLMAIDMGSASAPSGYAANVSASHIARKGSGIGSPANAYVEYTMPNFKLDPSGNMALGGSAISSGGGPNINGINNLLNAGNTTLAFSSTLVALGNPITNFYPTSATTDLGRAANPFANFWLGTAATNNFKFSPAATSAARTISIPDPGANTNLSLNLNATNGLYQTRRAVAGCTTAASIGGTCATDITVTWGTAFADANYSVTCTGNTPTNVPAAPFIVSGTKLAATVHINYFAITAAAASYASIDCTAVHD